MYNLNQNPYGASPEYAGKGGYVPLAMMSGPGAYPPEMQQPVGNGFPEYPGTALAGKGYVKGGKGSPSSGLTNQYAFVGGTPDAPPWPGWDVGQG